MNLHVLTAVTRPENLPALYESIYEHEYPDWRVYWHLLHLDQPSLGGQKVKNLLIEVVDDPNGWVYVLDDDTIMHASMPLDTAEVIRQNPDCDLLFFGRWDHGTEFRPDVKVGSIDIGQALIRRDLIDEQRIPDLYDGDGHFLVTLEAHAKNAISMLTPLAFYNRLR